MNTVLSIVEFQDSFECAPDTRQDRQTETDDFFPPNLKKESQHPSPTLLVSQVPSRSSYTTSPRPHVGATVLCPPRLEIGQLAWSLYACAHGPGPPHVSLCV